ncbi:MAG: FAD-binding oxidoreductase, partial [Clostridia bacterium]|nr:FAD-binding oxidoreductase [Clostridia bacterium]
MESIWKKVNKNENINEITEDIERDVVIIGGGIAGFLTAYRLAEKGSKVTLIEANVLFSGVTQFTTAHIEALQGIKYSALKNRECAQLYFESQIAAIDELEALVKKHNIDCDFKRLDSYLYTNTDVSTLKREYEILKDIRANVEFSENASILNAVAKAAIVLHDQASFEPIKFLSGLPINFELIENTRIIDVDYKEKVLFTEKYRIKAEKIVIATNFPIINVPGWYFLRMY